MTRIAIITNEAPPYRTAVFERVARMPGVELQVMFCARREPNRKWDIPTLSFDHIFLRERIFTVRGRYIHNNPDVFPALARLKPAVIVTDQFNPTHLYAFGYAKARRIPHVAMTDGTLSSEMSLGRVHRLVRRLVYARSAAFIAASEGGRKLYESYGVSPEHCFLSYLCTDNDLYRHVPDPAEKTFDLIFCGRMEPVKGPMFALAVAEEAARMLGRRVRILFVGSGSEEARIREAALHRSGTVDVQFHGFASQHELPGLYRSARVFLFPTRWDPWGVVANEACAAGLPVIVTPHAGVAGELVMHGENGYICELDARTWAAHAVTLLTRDQLWHDFSARSRVLVEEYSFDKAAAGLLDACRHALAPAEHSKRPIPGRL